ncbi:leucine-rich repeat serine/threonine-protein kinase 2-like [Halichondria panicea]|uniref:leucine-rich repeat serine/threonine-protein kinase 2-like n=1 Tax=Halichondria panicea TaxID=6063 RepID=UPI00312B5F7F
MSDYLTIADLGDLYIATFDARIKWRNFLLVLKIPSDTIDSIGKDWSNNPDDCYREGLKEWLKGGERSWEDVFKALSSPIVGHSDIARTIEKDHLQSTDASNPTDVKSEVDENHQKINDDLTVFLDELLGKGAFGAVFKGSYKGEICAVKLLIYEAVEMQTGFPVGKSEEASKASDRECEYLQSLQHPNVVLYLSTAKHPKSGDTILVVELMDCSLRSYFSSLDKESLTSECEISLSKDMACGLAYIHSKQIIHRDLCGDNVLLKLTQPVPVAKISDFGMSRLCDFSELSHTLTAIDHRKGYLPLEAPQRNYDNSVDVFSLGAIMVQIVCKLKTIKSVEDRSFHVAQIPHTHRLRKLIDSCLQEDMRRRPSARDIYASLTSDSDTVEATKRKSKDTQVKHQVSEKDTHSQASMTIDRLQAKQVCGLEEVITPQQEQFEVQPREIDHLVKSLQIQPWEDTQPDNNLTADVDLTSGSDTVEATKRESKDTQPVKKAYRERIEHKDAVLVRRDAIIQHQHTIIEDVCKKTGVRDQQLDQEIPESDIILIAVKFPHLLNVHKALNINDLHHVYEKLHESASPHWFNLGLALGLTYPVLTNISIASIME